MKDHGGFEHNVQALRIVDLLERPYPDRPGLNLCHETRGSILKHGPEKAGELGREFERLPHPWLEAQVVDLADSIAYLSHDVDDGLRFGVLSLQDLEQVELWQHARLEAQGRYPKADLRELIRPALNQTLHLPIVDVIEESDRRIQESGIRTPTQAREAPRRLIAFSPPMQAMQTQLKGFLFERYYRAERVVKERAECRTRLRELFEYLLDHPKDMQERPDQLGAAPRVPFGALDSEESSHARRVCDYVAGMTDRFTTSENERLCRRSRRPGNS